ncbi:hypothetical protein [Streptomyces sp. NPDC058718]|uniref:hypothetical protein n=1 Tax=Streptomyces sp. NPDC058718 TaxID=3346610 RepID=UPI0036BFEB74
MAWWRPGGLGGQWHGEDAVEEWGIDPDELFEDSPMPPSPPRRDRRTSFFPAMDRTVRKASVLRVRRADLTRLGVWAALPTGPVALLASGGRPVAPAAVERPATVTRTIQPETAVDSSPGGYDALVLGLWLGAGSDVNGAAARRLRVLAPSVRIPD